MSRRGAASGEGLGNAFLSHITAVDGVFHVCRGFEVLKSARHTLPMINCNLRRAADGCTGIHEHGSFIRELMSYENSRRAGCGCRSHRGPRRSSGGS